MTEKRPEEPGRHAWPRGLSPQEIRSYYATLSSNITSYDCGTLCAPRNAGVPFCCSIRLTVPLLYRSELALLQEMGDQWTVWNPGNARSRRLMRQLSREEVYCQCTGPENCMRDQRSLACRTFPFEPYIDEAGRLTGLVFLDALVGSRPDARVVYCPLMDRPEDIRQEYIDDACSFWEAFLRIPVEYETYRQASRSLRRGCAKRGMDLHLLRPG